MITLLVYTLKSALVLTLLYLPYTLMLRQESFFKMNRATLLTILSLALILPLCNFPSFSIAEQPTVYDIHHRMVLMVQDISASTAIVPPTPHHHFSILSLIALFNIAGIVFALCVRLWQLIRIGRLIRSGCLWKEKQKGVTVYCHIGDVAPFSWMQNIVISESDYQSDGCREILLHEKAHILCRHSLDILLLTWVEALQWWNPVAYKLGNSLRDVHEYEADDLVLRQGISIRHYQTLLAKKAVANTSYAFANNFNHSLIKKRFYMMNHPKSSPWQQSKVLYLLPMTLIVLSVLATPKLNETVKTAMKKVEADKPMAVTTATADDIQENRAVPSEEPTPDKHVFPTSVKIKDVVFVVEGTIVTRKEFEAALQKRHEIYVANMKGLQTCLDILGIKDAVLVQDKAFEYLEKEFGFDTLGKMIWIQTFEKPEEKHPDDSPQPAKPVEQPSVSYDTGHAFHQPEFPGGSPALHSFLQNHINDALLSGIAPTDEMVYVRFIIETDGSVRHAEIRKSVNESADRAALQMIDAMPRWIPARSYNGEIIRCAFTLPVQFKQE